MKLIEYSNKYTLITDLSQESVLFKQQEDAELSHDVDQQFEIVQQSYFPRIFVHNPCTFEGFGLYG